MAEPVAVVFVSWGYWVADCPRPDCGTSQHFGQAEHTGHVGGLTLTGFTCPNCGLVCRAQWPSNAADIWRVLEQRPMRNTRNWHPGETVHDLFVENLSHGLVGPDELRERDAVMVLNDRLTAAGRALTPASYSLPEIGR
jgi:hypothetical protein